MVSSRSPDGGRRVLDYCGPDGGPGNWGIWLSRGAAMVACAGVCLAIVLIYSGEAWLSVLSVLCVEGMLALGWAGAAGLLGAVCLRLPSPGTPGESDTLSRYAGRGEGEGSEPTDLVRHRSRGVEPSPGLRPTSPGVPGEVKEVPLCIVTSIALGLGIFSLVTLGLGLAGWLNRATAILLLVGSAAIGLGNIAWRLGNLKLEPYTEAAEAWLRRPAGWAWLWLAAMPFLGMAMVSATLPPGLLWPDPPGDPHPYDVLEYHLQVPREWYEMGRIAPLKHNVFSYFPFNVEVQYLLAMQLRGGPWAGMYLAQLMTLMYTGLAVGGIYGGVKAIAAEQKRRSDEATERRREEDGGLKPARGDLGPHLAGVAAATVPWLMMLGCVAYDECGLLLYGVLAIAWIMVGLMRVEGRVRSLAMAGVMAGFACGVKYTAVPVLLVGAPVIATACFVVRHVLQKRLPEPSAAAAAAEAAPTGFAMGVVLYVVLGLAACAPWLVRNVIWSGNPVFPEAAHLLGRGHFSAQQVERWETAHSAAAGQKPMLKRLRAARDQIILDWRYGFVLLPLGVIAAAMNIRRAESLFLLLLLGLLLVFWLALTHLQGRFFVLAVPVAAMLVGLMRWRPMLLATVCLVLVALAPSWIRLDQTLGIRLGPARTAAVGVTDLSQLLPQELSDLVARRAKIALVGDARAFLYTCPMSDLRYRTVFDVNAGADDSAIDSWLGPDAAKIKSDHYLVIAPRELERLARTYRGIPSAERFRNSGGLIIVPPR